MSTQTDPNKLKFQAFNQQLCDTFGGAEHCPGHGMPALIADLPNAKGCVIIDQTGVTIFLETTHGNHHNMEPIEYHKCMSYASAIHMGTRLLPLTVDEYDLEVLGFKEQ